MNPGLPQKYITLNATVPVLGQACIQAARKLSATKVYLESNTLLKPAINLYTKLGFQKITGHSTPYKRCIIQMEERLDNKIGTGTNKSTCFNLMK
ncbi:MAG: GNAT family N-acetyltransferase [Lewinellaceae bacterium]|nr:GNAT family N-acetyltransferase [Lewinellaceae bacterium]